MSHPLSEIITQRLNGDDPHARTTITNAEAKAILDELNRHRGQIRVFYALSDRTKFRSVPDHKRVNTVHSRAEQYLSRMGEAVSS